MEQSREVYETATTQLGSFLELVSSRLTTKQLPDTSNLNHRVSQGHVSNVSHSNMSPGHVSHSNVSHSNVSHVSRTSSSATGTRQVILWL